MAVVRETKSRKNHTLLALVTFVVGLLAYLYTLAPSVSTIFDDTLEFQVVIPQLGIAHPTGYPLFVLLGKLFTLLPVGDIAYRTNLLSARGGRAHRSLRQPAGGQGQRPQHGRLRRRAWRLRCRRCFGRRPL